MILQSISPVIHVHPFSKGTNILRQFRHSFLFLAILVSSCAISRGSAAQQPEQNKFFLHHGDTVVFMGDSITALHRATWPTGDISPNYTYCMDIVTWVTAHSPAGKPTGNDIEFYDLGVGGDTTQGDEWPNGGPAKDMYVPPSNSYAGSHTIDSDLAYVEALNPTVVTLDFGMNDGEYVHCDPAGAGYNATVHDDFTSGLAHIVTTLLSWSAQGRHPLRIVVLTPSYFDNARRVAAGWSFGWGPPVADYNQTLQAFGSWERSYVSSLRNPKVTCIDLNGPMAEATAKLPAGQSLTQEGIHPTEQGYEVMAAAILRAWGAGQVQPSDIAPSRNGSLSQAVWNAFNYGQQTLVPQAGGGQAASFGWTGPAVTPAQLGLQLTANSVPVH
jgi:lysophospholipase L1-like esterase